MNPSKNLMISVACLLLVLSFFSVYTVNQTERALVLVLGRIVTNSDGTVYVAEPGLHVKWPFVTRIVRLDQRLQTLDIEDSRIVTLNKKDVLVNSFVKWRVQDFSLFYRATGGNFTRANELLEQKVSDGLRAQFGKSTINQVVTQNRDLIMRDLSQEVGKNAGVLGIEIVDVRIKRIDLPDEVSSSVFDRMRAERQQVAAEHRASGEKKAEIIRANADKQAIITVATAQSQGRITRGTADALVAGLYAKAYQKDPSFFTFYRSMQAYSQVFADENDLFILSPDSDFFRYFKRIKSE